MTTQNYSDIINLSASEEQEVRSSGQTGPDNQSPSPNSSPAGQPAKRLFIYDGQYWEDPGPEYSIEDILAFLSDTYPELQNGTWTSRTLPDGTEEITFVKVTGEKGAGVTPQLLADRLCAGTTPTDIWGVELLHHLLDQEETGQLSAAILLAATAEIEAALQQTDQITQHSQRMVARCLALKPVPLPQIPLGF
jgi:PRTRC genetic system protein C